MIDTSSLREAQIILFNHSKYGKIRTMLIDNEPWFFAIDVARALGYSQPDAAIRRHCKHQKSLKILTPTENGGTPTSFTSGEVTVPKIIPQSDLYRLTARSYKREARIFMDWVYEEVLPSIQKTGEYKIEEKAASKQVLIPGDNEQAIIPAKSESVFSDSFFAGAAKVVKEAVDMCFALGFDQSEARIRAIHAINKRYDVDLEFYVGKVDMEITDPHKRPLRYKDRNTAAQLFTPTQIGILAQEKGYTDIAPSASTINIALHNAALQKYEKYTNSKREQKGNWRLYGEGFYYGKELELDASHSSGRPIIHIKWKPSVLDVIQQFLPIGLELEANSNDAD